jgi:predicted Ser/Thr protein kinase
VTSDTLSGLKHERPHATAPLPQRSETETLDDVDPAVVRAVQPGTAAGLSFRTPEDALGHDLGAYRLISVLGRGGMGVVFEAEHRRLGRRVAIKVLLPEHAARVGAVARFFQEAKAVNQICHSNIVDITDCVQLDDGATFIVMELLEGTSLWAYLQERGRLDQAELLEVVVQVCRALEAAHDVGIVHRDLKPGNIFLGAHKTGEHWVKLLDFGAAKLTVSELGTEGELPVQTATGVVLGTPAYMSPEQSSGSPVDGRSDVYALGAIMYESICGRPVFEGVTMRDYQEKHLAERPVPPSELGVGVKVDPALESVIMRCLEKQPSARYASVRELRRDLEQLSRRRERGAGVGTPTWLPWGAAMIALLGIATGAGYLWANASRPGALRAAAPMGIDAGQPAPPEPVILPMDEHREADDATAVSDGAGSDQALVRRRATTSSAADQPEALVAQPGGANGPVVSTPLIPLDAGPAALGGDAGVGGAEPASSDAAAAPSRPHSLLPPAMTVTPRSDVVPVRTGGR